MNRRNPSKKPSGFKNLEHKQSQEITLHKANVVTFIRKVKVVTFALLRFKKV